jgi:hypothetical protein
MTQVFILKKYEWLTDKWSIVGVFSNPDSAIDAVQPTETDFDGRGELIANGMTMWEGWNGQDQYRVTPWVVQN